MFITRKDRPVVNGPTHAQPTLEGVIWCAAIAVLVASALGCSSEAGGSAPSGGSGATSGLDGSTLTGGGMNSTGGGASGGPGQGGNMTGAGGSTSAGGAVVGSGGSSRAGGGGTSVGGAIAPGGRSGSGGTSTGSGGGSAGACPGVGASCDPTTTFCCAGLVCVTSTSADYAGCREECTTAADCASGCCIPFANIPNKGFCGTAALCQCAGDGETCGGTRQCCGGFSCSTFDGTGALACHKSCAQNSDCSTNCCVQVQGTSDKVCLPAKPFCGP